jgi:SHS2 domain-containing protein
MNKWELFSHGADIGIRGVGDTLEQAFEMAGFALTNAVIDPERIHTNKVVTLVCEQQNVDFLFYEWINHVITEMDTKQMLFNRFKIAIHQQKLTATLQGDEIKNIHRNISIEFKRANLAELMVRQKNGNWIAQCVVDI